VAKGGDRQVPYDVYAPLERFVWGGTEFQLGPDVRIRGIGQLPDLSNFQDQLSNDEWERAVQTSHWLQIDWDGVADQEPNGTTNLALLSLWLAKPTRARVTLRFQIARPLGQQTTRSRVLDRFAWIEEPTNPEFTNNDLTLAANFYATLAAVYRARGRLNDALLLTVSGCWSHFWQSALICHAAAAEAILTYSTAPRITKRLATSFACLTETTVAGQNAAYREFVDLYSIRSDIMHGRIIPFPYRIAYLLLLVFSRRSGSFGGTYRHRLRLSLSSKTQTLCAKRILRYCNKPSNRRHDSFDGVDRAFCVVNLGFSIKL
jgi:hypothetical protein